MGGAVTATPLGPVQEDRRQKAEMKRGTMTPLVVMECRSVEAMRAVEHGQPGSEDGPEEVRVFLQDGADGGGVSAGGGDAGLSFLRVRRGSFVGLGASPCGERNGGEDDGDKRQESDHRMVVLELI